MTKAPYIALLSQEERAGAIKAGMAGALVASGLPPSRASTERLVKAAEGFAIPTPYGAVELTGKMLAALSLLAGAPIGAMAHYVDRAVTAQTPAEKERLNRIRYYRDLTHSLEAGLPGAPA